MASRTRVPSAVSGEVVKVSGEFVELQSGSFVSALVSGTVQVASGTHVQISGQHVFVESGVQIASGTGVQVQSGIGVLVSGQHVYVESGLNVIVQSGLGVLISGQHVFAESGIGVLVSGQLTTTSGIGVTIQSGVGVTVQSGIYLASGIYIGIPVVVKADASWTNQTFSGLMLASGGSILVSGQGVIVGTATLSGLRLISGQSVTIASGPYVNWVQASGSIAVQSGEIHVMSGAVTIYLLSSEPIINNSGNPLVVGAISHGIPLWSNAVISVTIKALSANSGDIYLGGFKAGQGPYSGQGFLLEPGEAINMDVDNTGKIHLFAELSGDRVTYAGITG